MEFIARRPSGGTVGYWLKSLCGSLLSGGDAADRDAAAVVARPRSGPELVLLRTGTYRQALRARDRFQAEFERLGEEEFRRRYGLPELPR